MWAEAEHGRVRLALFVVKRVAICLDTHVNTWNKNQRLPPARQHLWSFHSVFENTAYRLVAGDHRRSESPHWESHTASPPRPLPWTRKYPETDRKWRLTRSEGECFISNTGCDCVVRKRRKRRLYQCWCSVVEAAGSFSVSHMHWWGWAGLGGRFLCLTTRCKHQST